VGIDPRDIDRPSEDAGLRAVVGRLDTLESRLTELAATIGAARHPTRTQAATIHSTSYMTEQISALSARRAR